jgi:hypothetical protein
MKIIRVVSSEVWQTVRPEMIKTLQLWVDSKGENYLYPFQERQAGMPREYIKDVTLLEGYSLKFTVHSVLKLLEKAILISGDTPEGMEYQIKKVFGPGGKLKGTAPGTLRFYSNRHICFWTGKNWRRITP